MKGRPQYLNKEVTRHGKTLWYVRLRREGRDVRVPVKGEYGSKEFFDAYRSALRKAEGEAPPPIEQRARVNANSLQWLIASVSGKRRLATPRASDPRPKGEYPSQYRKERRRTACLCVHHES